MNSVNHYLKKAWESFIHILVRYLRRLTKELVIFLPALVIILLIFNLLQTHTLFENTKNKASQSPRDLKSKLVLGRLLFQNNNLDSADFELKKIISSKKNDTKTKLEAEQLLQQISMEKNTPGEIRNEIKYWQLANKNYPSSRDINLKLAFLNWKLYRIFEANKYLVKAQGLDPNNETVNYMRKSLKN